MAVGFNELYAHYILSTKNKPCVSFWMSSGFSQNDKDNRFSLANYSYPYPKGKDLREDVENLKTLRALL